MAGRAAIGQVEATDAAATAYATAQGWSPEDVVAKARDKTLAMMFLEGADHRRYSELLNDLENVFVRNTNQYPVDLADAYTMLCGFKPRGSNNNSNAGTVSQPASGGNHNRVFSTTAANTNLDGNGMTFARVAAPVQGVDGETKPQITCFKCKQNGHYAHLCPSTDVSGIDDTSRSSNKTGVQMLQTGTTAAGSGRTHFSFLQETVTHDTIPDTWILLDSQSTMSVFKNPNFLENIRENDSSITVLTNGGEQTSTLVGDINNFGTVWYNPESIANFLSLAEVRQKCRVTMDTDIGPVLHIHKKDGSTIKFTEHTNGLYVHNPYAPTKDYTFVSTVEANKQLYTDREVSEAEAALALHRKLGRPSQKHFEQILQNNLIRNCPVTIHDAKRASKIFGPCVANLKGTAVKHLSVHVASLVPVTVPPELMELHSSITICVDIFFVQRIPFLTTISRKLKFWTVALLPNRKKESIFKELFKVINLYQSTGFTIPDIHCDNEFYCLENDLYPIQLNVTPADDHVGEIERSIRTIKERVRTTIHGLPFRRYPKLMIREVVFAATKWLNYFPAAGGISNTLSPYTIMTGKPSLDYNLLRLEFGSYVQIFEDNDPTNTTKSRNTGAIALSHTGNLQGDYFFMSLDTGKRLSRHAWTVVPMPNIVIDNVEQMALQERQPQIDGDNLLFEFAHNVPMVDDDFVDEVDDDFDEAYFVLNGFEDAQPDPIDDDEQVEEIAVPEPEVKPVYYDDNGAADPQNE